MLTLRHIVPLLLILALLSGCSSGIQLGYRQLDWLIPGWIDRQVDLQDRQYDLLKTSVREQLYWHCTSELPVYAQWINATASEFSAGMSVDQATVRYEEMVAAWNRLMHNAAIPLADLASTFSEAQVTEVLAAFDQRNAEYIAEYLDHDDEQRREIYVQWMTRSLKRRLGTLTDQQVKLVNSWSRDIDLLTPELRNARQVAYTRLASLLAQRNDNPALLEGIRELLHEERSSDSQFDIRYRENTRKALTLLSDVSYTLTDAQRKRLARRTSSVAKAFNGMQCRVFEQHARTDTSPLYLADSN